MLAKIANRKIMETTWPKNVTNVAKSASRKWPREFGLTAGKILNRGISLLQITAEDQIGLVSNVRKNSSKLLNWCFTRKPVPLQNLGKLFCARCVKKSLWVRVLYKDMFKSRICPWRIPSKNPDTITYWSKPFQDLALHGRGVEFVEH